jgi:integrase
MASIRNRSPWRVTVATAPGHNATFATKKQAEQHAQALRGQGQADVRVAQDRNGAWEARVRRRGGQPLVKTFDTRKMAADWAAAREGEIVNGQFIDTRAAERCTVGELFRRFSDEKTRPGPEGDSDRYRLKAFRALPLAELRLSALQPADIAAFRDAEIKRGLRPATVVKELELMARVINIAHREWGIRLPINPASAREVSRPKLGEDAERNRTLSAIHLMSSAEEVGRRVAKVSGDDRLKGYEAKLAVLHRQGVRLRFHPEVADLMEAPMTEQCALARAARYPHWFLPVRSDRNPAPLIVAGLKARERGAKCRIWAIQSFGIETAMRRGEMAKLRWEYVHLDEGYLALPGAITKNKRGRVVPLTRRARRILLTQPRTNGLVFSATVESIETAHHFVIARSGAHDLRFHDLRHEATTRLVQGTTLPSLLIGQITGHRDPRMLARYYNPTPEQIVNMFNASRR